MTILAGVPALALVLAASTALAQTAPQTPPAKPDAVPQAGQACPNRQAMGQGRMMNGQRGPHMGAVQGQGGQGAQPGRMMSGRMMGRGGANCLAQATPAPDAKGQDSAPPKAK